MISICPPLYVTHNYAIVIQRALRKELSQFGGQHFEQLTDRSFSLLTSFKGSYGRRTALSESNRAHGQVEGFMYCLPASTMHPQLQP